MPTFDERAPEWDTPEHIERAETAARLILDAVSPPRDAAVLELGAGTGLLGLALLPHVGSVVLADPSDGMLEVARAKLASGRHPGARTLRLALPADAIPAERFDLVVSLLAMHHVLDTAAALVDLARLIVPGGRIALVDLEAEDGTFHGDPDEPVLHGFARGELRQALETAGFTDVVFMPAWEMTRDGRTYPLFLVTAARRRD